MIILRNKEFARKDYEGLSEEQKKAKLAERKKLANEIRDMRSGKNKRLTQFYKNAESEINKIAREDLRNYILGGESDDPKKPRPNPEKIERRRRERLRRLDESVDAIPEEKADPKAVREYLNEQKKKINDKYPSKPKVKTPVKIPYKKIGKYSLVGTALVAGTIGTVKAVKKAKESRERRKAKAMILGNSK